MTKYLQLLLMSAPFAVDERAVPRWDPTTTELCRDANDYSSNDFFNSLLYGNLLEEEHLLWTFLLVDTVLRPVSRKLLGEMWHKS